MKWWRTTWDISYSLSSISLALLLGIVLGNVLQGADIGPDLEFAGNWLTFFNPFAFMVGITTLALFMMHGAIYLTMKTEGRLFAKITILLRRAIIFFILSFICTSFYALIYIPHLSDDFKNAPILFLIPLLTFLSIANIPRLVNKKNYQMAFVFSSLTVSLLLILVAIELYPILIFSTSDPTNHITIYKAAASDKSIRIMLGFVAVGVPLVASYTYFVYRTFRGKVKMDEMSY